MIPARIDRLQLPHQPGVYQFFNNLGQVIYVGKAIDLYHRVASYFNSSSLDHKTHALVEDIASVKTIVVESELEALVLEANLIKKFLPRYNIRLTDDKDYLYIKITKESFPKIITARKKDLAGSLKYFGPFISSRTVKNTLKLLRRVFPWCSGLSNRWHRASKDRACFYYHIGQCPGACIGKISQKDYQQIIKHFIQFMEGKKISLIKELTQQMRETAKNQQFELAGKIKNTLDGVSYLTQSNRIQVYLENPNFLEDQRQKALEKLQEVLSLRYLPQRIECYDISNISGKEATGSMVVLTNGEIDKSQYRKFKIFITGKPNDVGMMREVIRRRLKHSEWSLPDLMLIDGGQGQVNGVYQQLQAAGCTLPLFGLAKRMEWLYAPDGTVVKLARNNPALKMLQKIRDEAHRFAITYHRKLRDNILLSS